jgi:hypothetical protein
MDWSKPPDEEALRNYRELKSKLDAAIQKAGKTKDLREAKGYLIEVQGRFKGLKLLREQREELYGRLQAAFEQINRKIEEDRHSFENEAQLNYFELKKKVEEAQFLAEHPKELKETWDFLVGVQSAFKGTRLLREHREELYARLQAAFEKVKALQHKERSGFEKEAEKNYPDLREAVDEAVRFSMHTEDLRSAREKLIGIQNQFRETKLLKEQREELYAMLQEGFTFLKIRQEETADKYDALSEENYTLLLPRLKEIATLSENAAEFHPVREKIKELQAEMKDLTLKREHRDQCYKMLQDAFETLSLRQDTENDSFEKEARRNYERLKTLVSQGLVQAEETHQYKETREFLKMIQSEFKGIKLIREQREELYSRLQTAFDILGKRLDDFFRQKKKNWAVKMEYRLSEYNAEIFDLEAVLEKEQEALSEMEDQLEIMISGGKDNDAIIGLKARISSAKTGIERKKKLSRQLKTEMDDLKNKLEPEENT